MKGLGSHTPLIPKGKPPLSLAVVDALPSCTYFSRTTAISSLRCRQKSRLSLAHGIVRAQASNVSVGPGDYGSNNEKDGQNLFERNPVNDSSSKTVKPNRIPYPISIALVLFGCTLVFSLIAFVKGGPSSVLAAIAKSGFTAAFTLIFISEIGDKAIADQNAENRSKQTVLHTLGTKSLARAQHELELQNGRTYTRGDMYQVSHMKKDGEFINDEAREIYEQLQEEIQHCSNENEAFVAVFGKEHSGYVRSMGLGVVPSQISGRNPSFMANSESDPKIAQMQLQIDTLKEQLAESNRLREEQLAEQAAESKKLKAKMAEFDVVKQQLAYLMRNARGNHPGSSSNGAI